MFQPRKLIAAVTVSGAVVPLSTKKPPETVLCFNLLGVAVDEGGEEDESIQTIDIPHKYDAPSLARPLPCQSTGGVELVELGHRGTVVDAGVEVGPDSRHLQV